jgi:PKD repeat protein
MFRSRVFLVVLALAAAFSLPASATELPLGGAGGTYSDGTRTRGYWFVAPVTFTIDALRVPNVGGGPQNLQVMTLPSNPPTYSGTTTNYTTLFYTNSGSSSAGAWVPVNVTINAGQVVGILGARGTGTMHNAYANSNTFTSNIAGNSITLRRFGTQVNLHNQQAGPVWTESYTYSRVEMDYSVGPVALAGGAYSGVEGSGILVDGSGSTGATSYAWDCDTNGVNDCSGSNATCACVYPDQGVYTATLVVTGSLGTDTDTAVVTVSNVPPSAVTIGGPSTGTEGSSLAFTGSAVDVPADPITYSWTFGDGGTSNVQNPSHTYADDGTYTVTLTASDGDGGSASTTTSVVVSNANPAITSLTSNAPQSEGSPIAFTTAVTDPGTLDTHTYAWTFGDGTTGTGANPSHIYADDGTYPVTVIVTDDDGGTATASINVTVTNSPPTAVTISGPTSGTEGSPLSFVGSAVDVSADPITYFWSFGDGGTATVQSPTHTYADDGTYTVTLTASDGDGGSTAVTASVVISNANPTITVLTSNAPQDEGTPTTFATTITDAGVLDTHTYAWTFGDGATGTGANPSHTYANDGTYSVSLTVTDDDGGTDTATLSVTVNNVAPTGVVIGGPSSGT